MESRSLQFVVAACAGDLQRGSPGTVVERVCTDSRAVRAGDLFVALAGEKFDGHEFVVESAQKGAAAVMINRSRAATVNADCPVVVVDDSRAALGRLAAAYRREFSPAMIAVAGSNGKTTTKELIASVLRQKLETLWSEASFNNDIGVPLTLLRLEQKHEAAVLEIGTNHPGELAPLVRLVEPRYGVITNIGPEHLEFFGDVAGVAEEEGWLAELLPAGGRLYVSGDSEWTEAIVRRARAKVVRVGAGEGNDWRVLEMRPDADGVSFTVAAPAETFSGEYRIQLLGRHQVMNALYAIAVGEELGLGRAEIERGLAECPRPKMRLQISEIGGVTILDDTYNANVDSMRAALATLRDLPSPGRRIAVLGDMAELGEHSPAAHQEVGRMAAEFGVGQLIAVGKMAGEVGTAARAAGMTRVFECADVDTAAHAVKSLVKTGDLVLLKASRATHLERVADELRASRT